MRRTLTHAAAVVTTALLAACSADLTGVQPLDAPARASLSGTPYEVDATVVTLVPGATHQLTATKSANGKETPDGSITWSSSNELVATVSTTGLVTAVGTGEAIVSATRGSHSQDVTVVVEGCGLQSLAIGTRAGTISATDCVVGPFRADLYSVGTGIGEVLRFEAAGIAGQLGIKVPGATLLGGVYQAVPIGYGVRVIGNGSPLHAFARSTSLGSYTMTRTAPAEAHDCADYNFVLPGSAFGTTLTEANSCRVNIAFPSIPEAYGKPIDTHWFNMYVEAGKSYTVTITGVSDSFNPSLTVFGGGVLGQSAPDGNPAPSSRTVTFARATNGYVGIEVGTGRFIGGLQPENWVIQHGAYAMTVSQ